MRINEPTQGKDIAPLWRLAFRAGFLAAAAFGVAAMLRWLFWMRSPADWPGAIAPQWWHGHEMVFGFALPVVAGFLLTAVATWTGSRPVALSVRVASSGAWFSRPSIVRSSAPCSKRSIAPD